MRDVKQIAFNGKEFPVIYNAYVVCEMTDNGVDVQALANEKTVLKSMYEIAYYGLKGGHLAKKKSFDMTFEEFLFDLADDINACAQCARLYSSETEKTLKALVSQEELDKLIEESEKKSNRRPRATKTQAKK